VSDELGENQQQEEEVVGAEEGLKIRGEQHRREDEEELEEPAIREYDARQEHQTGQILGSTKTTYECQCYGRLRTILLRHGPTRRKGCYAGSPHAL
jgi:hypothetical protein